MKNWLKQHAPALVGIKRSLVTMNQSISLIFFRLRTGYYKRQQRAFRKWLKVDGEHTLRYLYDIKENDVIFDMGGYQGEWTENMIQKYHCNSYVFEPVLSFYKHICDKFEKNPKVKVFKMGLGKKSQTATILLSDDASSCYSEQCNEQQETIQYRAVDEFFTEYPIECIRVMKINIEGGEYDLLEALIASGIINRIENIQVQFHHIPEIGSDKRMRKIKKVLRKTHSMQWGFVPYVWENWVLK